VGTHAWTLLRHGSTVRSLSPATLSVETCVPTETVGTSVFRVESVFHP